MNDSCHLSIHAELEYDVGEASSFAFAVMAAQSVRSERIGLTSGVDFDVEAYGEAGSHQLIRLDAPPGPLLLNYDAVVTVHPRTVDQDELGETPFGALPACVLPYMNPSRYCEPDMLDAMANRLFGGSGRNYARVREVNNWVSANMDYVSGVTDSTPRLPMC